MCRFAEPIPLPAVAADLRLWWSDLAHTPAEIDHARGWLSAQEIGRAERFGNEALRLKYIAGRAALRAVLASALGVAPATVPIRRGARGRPELDGAAPSLDFNISHTAGGAVIGVVSRAAGRRIGVDVEREDRRIASERIARKFLSPAEQATLAGADAEQRRLRVLRYWTCKEAMSKATGDGLGAPFARLTVALSPEPKLVSGPDPYAPAAWRLHALTVPSGFLATAALWQPDAARTPSPP